MMGLTPLTEPLRVGATSIVGFKEAFAPVDENLKAVKQSLLAILPPQSQILADSVKGSLNSGGKYLRPAITLLIGQALAKKKISPAASLQKDKQSSLVEVAAVSEMIHIATLLHDDVLDEAALRRGKPTVCAELGNKISVLSGDYLLAQASLKLATLGSTRLVSIYAQVLADLCDGEVEQMKASYDLDSPIEKLWESYTHKTYCKTASLFAAGCEAAGVVYGLPEADIQILIQFGKSFGMAFQVVDDLLDYTSSQAEMGKPVLDDLRHGLLTAPLLLALSSPRVSSEQPDAFIALLKRLFEKTSDRIGEADLAPVLTEMERVGAVGQTHALIQHHIQAATEALTLLPDCQEKICLEGLLSHIAMRRS